MNNIYIQKSTIFPIVFHPYAIRIKKRIWIKQQSVSIRFQSFNNNHNNKSNPYPYRWIIIIIIIIQDALQNEWLSKHICLSGSTLKLSTKIENIVESIYREWFDESIHCDTWSPQREIDRICNNYFLPFQKLFMFHQIPKEPI